MIEIKRSNGCFCVYANGQALDGTTVRAEISEDDLKFRVYIKSLVSSRIISEHKISEISKIKLIALRFGSNKSRKDITIISEDLRNNEKFEKYKISINLSTAGRRKEFSFTKYCGQLERIIEKSNSIGIYPEAQFSRTLHRRIQISFIHLSLSLTISEEINNLFEIVNNFHEETINALEKEKEAEISSLITSFNFPEELKVPCQQYLLYFAQFLRDLGISVTSELNEDAGKILFSITPTNDIDALDKIREALVIYLSLASNPITNSTGDRMVDMVLSGARANAKHLESQLELVIAKLQFKEATLELKDETIEQYQFALRQKDGTIKELQEIVSRKNIFEESLESEINGEVSEETSLYRFSRDDIEIEATSILDEKNEETRIGLVKFHEVTKLKDYGVTLDLPKAIRDLINFFKRDKDK
jgi:hypothetical protein